MLTFLHLRFKISNSVEATSRKKGFGITSTNPLD